MDRIESLERRQLFATVTATGNIIRIAGTSGNDNIDVSLLGKTQIRISDGTTITDLDRATYSRLTFIGGDGDDNITVGRVQLRSYFDGGRGNDSLSSSRGIQNDTLIGGEGNDYLFAGPGNDKLDGGNGGDFIIGNDGDDYLECKSEVNTDDTVSGGKGNDTVSLATYQQGTTSTIGLRNDGLQVTITDTMYGDIETFIGSGYNDKVFDFSNGYITYYMGAGNDTVLAGQRDDTIYGGSGSDSLAGGGGTDYFITDDDGATPQPDTLVGGDGRDYSKNDTIDYRRGVEKRFDVLPAAVIRV